MPAAAGSGSQGSDESSSGSVPQTLTQLVPTFDPQVDDVEIWSAKVELLLATWPPKKISELATRLILGCKGSAFRKLQLHQKEVVVNEPKGIARLVELVGGSWGRIPLERKFEVVEKALFKCIQKSDETADSFLSRCDVVWSEMLSKEIKLPELQAYTLLRGSRLSSDDKKRVVVESGAETDGALEMSRVKAAIRMLGSGFFQDFAGSKREKGLKVYDSSAFFTTEEPDETPEHEAYLATDDGLDDEALEVLAAENDEDAQLIMQFEEAVIDTVQSDGELSAFFSAYQDARRRLSERVKTRGFWPVKRFGQKGKSPSKGPSKGKGMSKGRSAGLANRIANSRCRICNQYGHWKAECPKRDASSTAGSASTPATQVPTSAVTVDDDAPFELQHIPYDTRLAIDHSFCFGITTQRETIKRVVGNHQASSRASGSTFMHSLRHRLRNLISREPITTHEPSRSEFSKGPKACASIECTNEQYQVGLFASAGTIGVVDLGASQTVIGSRQVPELLSNLPNHVRKMVKRTQCHLVFRFGNHQTLTSKHALMFPLRDAWFQVAVVTGNTPFLLSSNFLRSTIQAVIDTEAGTIWSKALKKNLEVEITDKHLFLLDINQLWEPEIAAAADTTEPMSVERAADSHSPPVSPPCQGITQSGPMPAIPHEHDGFSRHVLSHDHVHDAPQAPEQLPNASEPNLDPVCQHDLR
eukprot:Skav220391  [mRNA]  locus=scaffold639:189900:191999:+ [translate_table: standard]